ncbi:MAG TPA: hypothetical protein ENO09_08575 [bacterium]|nr:hypothetical protein [bacterium]
MNYAERYRYRRVVWFIPVLLVLFFLLWQETREPAPVLSDVQGRVMEVNTAESQGLRGSSVHMTTARVRVEDGYEARVLVMGQNLRVGDEVTLTESRREDGSRHYSLARGGLN